MSVVILLRWQQLAFLGARLSKCELYICLVFFKPYEKTHGRVVLSALTCEKLKPREVTCSSETFNPHLCVFRV